MFAADLFPDEASPRPTVLSEDAFLSAEEHKALFDWCLNNVPWENRTMNFGGRDIAVPRQLAWFGDASYAYSGIRHRATSMPLTLRSVADRIEAWLEARGVPVRFNSLLLNHYRDGADSISMHSDDEPELGEEPVIASMSLGASRTFVFQHKRSGLKLQEPLVGGSLLVMHGNTQREWRHGIPKETTAGARVNLTFRSTHK